MASQTNGTPILTFYEIYKDAGIVPEFVILHAFRWLISLFGMSLDFLLILITIRTKSLQGPFNLLIAFGALSSAFFQFGPSVTFYLALRGQNFMSLANCFLVQSLPMLGISLSLCSTLFVGLDRLLSVAMPVWHKRKKKWAYLCLMLLASHLYALFGLYLCWKVCMMYSELQVMCTINVDCYQGWADNKMFSTAFLLNAFTIGVYVSLWVVVRRKVASGDSEQSFLFTRRILKSITLILCTTVFGWSLASSARIILPILALSDRQNVFLANVLGYATNLAAASTLPVLFFCSGEYRKATLAMFGFKKETAGTAVQTLTK